MFFCMYMDAQAGDAVISSQLFSKMFCRHLIGLINLMNGEGCICFSQLCTCWRLMKSCQDPVHTTFTCKDNFHIKKAHFSVSHHPLTFLSSGGPAFLDLDLTSRDSFHFKTRFFVWNEEPLKQYTMQQCASSSIFFLHSSEGSSLKSLRA